MTKSIILNHKNQDIIQDWARALQLQAENLDFSRRYTEGHEIASNQYSRVYQCQNKDTNEVVAVKYIYKNSIIQKNINMLMRELQINRMLSHDYLEEIKEIFEDENEIKIVRGYQNGDTLR